MIATLFETKRIAAMEDHTDVKHTDLQTWMLRRFVSNRHAVAVF